MKSMRPETNERNQAVSRVPQICRYLTMMVLSMDRLTVMRQEKEGSCGVDRSEGGAAAVIDDGLWERGQAMRKGDGELWSGKLQYVAPLGHRQNGNGKLEWTLNPSAT
ncbi:hypothetical protein ACFE04_023064 [Oxalis oulophora]